MSISYNLTCRPNVFGVTSVVMTYSEAGSHTLGGFRPATKYNCSIFAFSGNRSGPLTSDTVTTPGDSRDGSNNSLLIGVALVVGIIAGASITSLIAIIACCVLRHRAHQKKNTQSSPGKR